MFLSAHDHAHAHFGCLSSCYPRPYLHDLFTSAPYFSASPLLSPRVVLSRASMITTHTRATAMLPPLYTYTFFLPHEESVPRARVVTESPFVLHCLSAHRPSACLSVCSYIVAFHSRVDHNIPGSGSIRHLSYLISLLLSPPRLRPSSRAPLPVAGYVSVVYLMYARLLD